MANSKHSFESGSLSPERRQSPGPSSLESDDAGIPRSHHSYAGNNGQRELSLGGVIPHRVDSATQPSDGIGELGQRLGAFGFANRIQQPSNSIVQSSGVPGFRGGVQQPDDIDDTIKQLSCSICFVRWLNVVVKTCRHLNCDVCYSKSPYFCGICRGETVGTFPLRFHSAHMIEDIDISAFSENQRNMIQDLMDMGFQRAAIRGAIRHASDGMNTTLSLNAILDILAPSGGSDKTNRHIESTYSIPTSEELEHILKDPRAKAEDKSRLVKWLQVTAKCLICKDKPPCMCLFPCFHLAICWECYEDTQKRPQFCPDSHCGQNVVNQVKIHP